MQQVLIGVQLEQTEGTALLVREARKQSGQSRHGEADAERERKSLRSIDTADFQS